MGNKLSRSGVLSPSLQILQVLINDVRYFRGNDKMLWGIISKNEYRRCAVIESYESIKHILLQRLLKNDSVEFKIIQSVFDEIDASRRNHRFTSSFLLRELLNVHARVVHLIEVLLSRPTASQIQKVRGPICFIRMVAVRKS